MTDEQLIEGIHAAAERRQEAAEARRGATDELRDLCAKAQAAGVSISQIAREASLSRQGVYDLLSARPSA